MAIIQIPSIAAVVEDQTPQLGGNLSSNGNNITVDGGGVYYAYGVGIEGDANYERIVISHDGSSATIGSEAGGTGTVRSLFFASGGTNRFLLNSSGDLLPGTNSTYNFGSASQTFAGIYSDTVTVGPFLSQSVIESDGANELALRNGTTAQAFNLYNTYTDASNYERLEVKWDTNVAKISTTSDGTGSARAINIGPAGNQGILFSTAGVTRFEVNTGSILCRRDISAGTDSSQTNGTTSLRWSNTYTDTITIGDGVDAVLTADAADTLALRNSTTAQQFNVYNTYTDASNYERLEVEWDANTATIRPTAAGTGTQRNLTVQTTRLENETNYSYIRVGVGTSAPIRCWRDVEPQIDSGYDLGGTSLRWSNTYTDTITIGDGVDAVLTADAADTLAMRNSTTAQAFNVYNTYTDASNYERLEIKWDSNVAAFSATSAGTGSSRSMRFDVETGSNILFRVGTTTAIQASSSRVLFSPLEVRPVFDGFTSLGISAYRWATTYTKGFATDVETFTAASDTLDAENNVALCDCTSNNITINLPAASTASGLQYHIKKIDSSANTVTIDGNGAETIDGATTKTISTQYDSLTVVSDGSNWFII